MSRFDDDWDDPNQGYPDLEAEEIAANPELDGRSVVVSIDDYRAMLARRNPDELREFDQFVWHLAKTSPAARDQLKADIENHYRQ